MSTFVNASPFSGQMHSYGEREEKPRKYIQENGVMKLNPAYLLYQQGTKAVSSTTLQYPEEALPVVCSEQELNEIKQSSTARIIEEEMKPAASVQCSYAMLEEDDICLPVGLSPEGMKHALAALFTKYEIPMGLMNKLFVLQTFDRIEHIIDDSYSMTCSYRNKHTAQTTGSRWIEALNGIKKDFEILAHVPLPPVTIRFLNRNSCIHILPDQSFREDGVCVYRSGKTPERFLEELERALDIEFAHSPEGHTPAREKITDSFNRYQNARVARYFHGDGEPNRGKLDIDAIGDLLKNRESPENSPFTFIVCSDRTKEVEWMEDVEEIAPFCASIDDFISERNEVAKDQGRVFPYTEGVYRIARIVSAMNPDDLDALDEAVPLTKPSLENFLGYTMKEVDYRRYFDSFKEAQNDRNPDSAIERVRKDFNWELHYAEFLTNMSLDSIRAVREYRSQLEQGKPPAYESQSKP